MASPERDVKKAAELKLWLEGRIRDLEEELDRLKETLSYVDETLRASTFKPAIEMMPQTGEVPETRELRHDKGGEVIAVASLTSDSVSIEPKSGVVLRLTTPPFKSFLVTKILQGMKSKDEALVAAGRLSKGAELRYDIEETNGVITGMVIENYRDRPRLNEILNTIAWTFSRMLEK